MSSLRYNRKTGMFETPRRKGGGKRFFSAGETADFLGWDVTTVSADAAIYSNLNKMKARCRDLARNNDHVRHALRLFQSNVIGPHGFRFQSKLKLKNGKRDRAFNQALELRWSNAGKKRHAPTRCGTLSRRDAAALWLRTMLVDGEAIAILNPGSRRNGSRFDFYLVDTARLDWQKNELLPNGNEIRMGVELDPDGRPVAYHFLNYDPTDFPFGFRPEVAKHERVPAAKVLHSFVHEMPGQTRGVPLLASPAVRAHMLARFEEAIVVGARVAASKMGFYKRDNDAESAAPGDEGDDFDLRQEVEPAMFEELPRGVSVETFDPNYPPANVEEFEKRLLKSIASGLGTEYVSMANDLEGVNYSSIRAGSLEQRSIYRGMQQFAVEHFEEPIFVEWLAIQQFNAPELAASKLDRLMVEEAWAFIGRGWQWVDPLKEVNAYEKAVAQRFTSRRRIVAETLGADYEELLEEIKEDQEAEKRWKVQPEAAAPTAPPPGEPAGPDEDEDNDEE